MANICMGDRDGPLNSDQPTHHWYLQAYGLFIYRQF